MTGATRRCPSVTPPIAPLELIPDPGALVPLDRAPDTVAGWQALADGLLTDQGCAFHRNVEISSRYAWLYGAEAGPSNSPGSGGPRHIYDEANVMLNSTVPAGHTIRLQKDPANSTTYTIDFINLELVAPKANPDPAHYRVPVSYTHLTLPTIYSV